MYAYSLTISRVGILVQGSSAIDRWRAMRDLSETGGQITVMWWILIVLGILVVAGTISAVVYRHAHDRRKWEKFQKLGLHAGLRDKEMMLLESVVKLAKLKDPATIYTDDGLFDKTAAGFMASPKVVASSDEVQGGMQSMLASMHAKLRFGIVSDGDELDSIMSSRQIITGSRVFISGMGDRKSIEGAISRNSPTELLIETEETLPRRRSGDLLTVRYAHGHGAWEFDVRVIRSEGSSVVVEHSSEMRSVNFRRYPRITTRMFATGTAFPFHVISYEDTLEFLPIDVVQIAGPGLLIKPPFEMDVGQSLLIRVRVDERRFVQGLTKVRRIVTDKPGGPFLAVEFIELTDEELTEMTRATNLAARHKGPPPSADRKMEAVWEA